MQRKITCELAKQIELINYLTLLDYFPYTLGSKFDCSFLSFGQPIVSQKDDFLKANKLNDFAREKKELSDGKIILLDYRLLTSKTLRRYLQKGQISLEIADCYCREIDFLLYGKKHTVIGFKNSAGGYELRSENYKGSSYPKDVTFIDNRTQDVAIFEGFFSFLSFCNINKNLTTPLTNFLVLNSLSFFQKERDKMEDHQRVHLYLDRDEAGIKHTLAAREWNKERYIDRSDFYDNHKDLNDWLMDKSYHQRQSLRPGRLL